MSSSAITVSESSRKGSKMGSSTKHPSSAISEHSSMRGTPTHIREWLMSLQQDSHASRFQSPESEQEETTAATSGPKHLPYFAQYDPDTRCWKTCQVCLLTNMPDEYSETWPKTGLMLNGVCYPQPNAERRISAIGSGSMLPTPSAQSAGEGLTESLTTKGGGLSPNERAYNPKTGKHTQMTLNRYVKLWPTPTTPTGGGERSKARAGTGSLAYMARTGKLWPTSRSSPNENRQTKPTPSQLAGKHGRSLAAEVNWPTASASDWKGSSKAGQRRGQLTDPAMGAIPAGGQLNPTWVEWLMGWPLGWTDLRPLEMGKFQQWQQQHGIY